MGSVFINHNKIFLKCSICSHPLSIKPIYYHPALGTICGRCENIKEKLGGYDFERQFLLEIMVKNEIFSCAYKNQGCLAEISADVAVMHEQNCMFKVIKVMCPLFDAKFMEFCTWIGDYQELNDHIRQKHSNCFNESLTFTLTPALRNKFIFSERNGNIILVMIDINHDKNTFTCSIMSDMNFKECLEKKFQIIFIAGNTVEFLVASEKLEKITPRVRISPEWRVAIPISYYNDLFHKHDAVTVSILIFPNENIKITCNNIFETEVHQNESLEISKLKALILRELECPVCAKLMAPPIYLCTEGHTLCSSCRIRISECPICRAVISGGKNLTLEELCSVVTGPCTYQNDGCSFISTLSKLKVHESFCDVALRCCVINTCEWFGRTLELPDHLRDEHTFRDLTKSYVYKPRRVSEQHMFLYEDKIILLTLCPGAERSISYSVHCLGGKYFQYEYEMEFIDPFIESNKIVVRNTCQPIGYNFKSSSFLLISIPFEMLKGFTEDNNELNYSLNMHTVSD